MQTIHVLTATRHTICYLAQELLPTTKDEVMETVITHKVTDRAVITAVAPILAQRLNLCVPIRSFGLHD